MKFFPGVIIFLSFFGLTFGQNDQKVSGTVVTSRFELVPNVTVEAETSSGKFTTVSDGEGRFSLQVPRGGPISLAVSGKNIVPQMIDLSSSDKTTDLEIKINYVVPPLAETVTIQADALTPQIERRDDTIYKNSLFARDDQLMQTLNAGINAGQHEGGGKSLEIRRYGFNLDHGGVAGGLKVMVDDVQQNQGTQAHGQGYLGSLKSVSPELVEEVSIISGPFSAAYGDFSGLGVVQIRLKESLPQLFTARIEGGSFDTFRGFFAYSPSWKKFDAFIAYEPSYTNGPFVNPLKYRRDNITSNITYKFSDKQAIGFKANFGRNDFTSSGQLPLDLVNSGELDRFGFIDQFGGGRVKLGTAAVYFRHETDSGAILRADAWVGRSLFDLFMNFTFFRDDPIFGDELDEHDSRLHDGGNIQYLQPYKLFGSESLLTVGANLHASQINVGTAPSFERVPDRKFLGDNLENPDVLLTSAHADITNWAGYAQNEINFFEGRLRVETGLRFDNFTFDVNGFQLTDVRTDLIGKQSDGKFQPKLGVAWTPSDKMPFTLYANYGRGISSQDARGIIRDPSSPALSTTDFYQTGGSYNGYRFSAVVSAFLIDRSNEQVYVPDEGTQELAGPSRSYGYESQVSMHLAKYLSFNGSFTNVIAAFYRGEFTEDGQRVVVTNAPHFTANAGLVLTEFRGFNSSLTLRHISHYRVDDPSLLASGNDVVDLYVSKRLRNWIDLNFSVDNLLNKKYYETQNFFDSRACPTCDVISRIHGTPGYPFTVIAGVTLRFGNKK
jgi:outer membrane receptor protein involved in Fe transport